MCGNDTGIKFFGLHIVRKTDFVALAALALSVSAILWQVIAFMRGSQTDMVLPGEVVLFSNYCEKDEGIQFLEIIGPVTYVNSGNFGYNDVLLDEKLHITFPTHTKRHPLQLEAGEIVKISHNDNWPSKEYCDNRKSSDVYPGITIESIATVPIVTLNAGSALTHTTHYFLDSKICSENWKDCRSQTGGITYREFVKRTQPGDIIEIEFHAKFLNDGYKRGRCAVELSEQMIEHFTSMYNLSTDCFNLTKYAERR